jgi:hypothetical protein
MAQSIKADVAPAKKNATKPKVETKSKETKSKFVLPSPGDKISPASGELATNKKPLVFEVASAEGNEDENIVYIQPVNNFYTTGQWVLVNSKLPVNF